MTCVECDRLEKEFIRPRTESLQRRMRGTWTPEIQAQLDSEESTALAALKDHRIFDHKPGDAYE